MMKRQLALVLIAILAASIVSVAGVVTTAPTADAATKTPTKIEITKGPHTPDGRTWAKRGETFYISGRLLTTDGKPVPSVNVYARWTRLNDKGAEIWSKKPGSWFSFPEAGNTKNFATRSDGSFEISDSCKEVNWYRYNVYTKGNKQYGGSGYDSMYIRIGLTRTTLGVGKGSIPTEHPLSGRVYNLDNKALDGVQVKLYKVVPALVGGPGKIGTSSKWTYITTVTTKMQGGFANPSNQPFFVYIDKDIDPHREYRAVFPGNSEYFSSAAEKKI